MGPRDEADEIGSDQANISDMLAFSDTYSVLREGKRSANYTTAARKTSCCSIDM